MNLKIGQRILFAVAVPLLLSAGFGIWLWAIVGDIQASARKVKDESIVCAMLARDMEREVVQVQQFLTDISATRAQDGLDEGVVHARRSRDRFFVAADRFAAEFAAEGDQAGLQAIAKLKARVGTYYESGVVMAQAYIDQGPAAGNKLMGGFDRESESLQAALALFVNSQTDEAAAELANTEAMVTWVRTTATALNAVSALVSFLLAMLLIRSIVEPLHVIQAHLARVGQTGDPAAAVDIPAGGDELGAVAGDLNRALRKIDDSTRQTVAELTTRASTDRLTGAWNRKRIEESAEIELSRLKRYGHPVSLIFIDIDHFKDVNDVHGHAAGDAVLRGLCDIVRACIRATDLLGRWGGEEFVLLLPNSGLPNAGLLAENMRKALAAHRFPGIGQLTASFGVAQCGDDETWESWVARADAAMYRAKRGGRNRVAVDATGAAVEDVAERIDAGVVRLVWRKAFECGHPVIDEQHRALFAKANGLLAAMVNGHRDDIKPLVDDLIAANLAHFRTEEEIISRTGFPAVAGHAGAHRHLAARVCDLAAKHAANQLRLGELVEFLAYELVTRHILTQDRKFFPYLCAARLDAEGPLPEVAPNPA